MSRKIDRFQPPAASQRKPIKVIVSSPSRSGTLGLYRAMQILGFKPYHLFECVVVHGLPHVEIFKEAVTAQYNRLSGVKRYDRADCDKWMTGYDCLVEIPSYMGMDVMEAYVDDPDVKFILTERDPQKWASSVNKTAAQVAGLATQFPTNILKYFDGFLYEFLRMNQIVYRAMAGGTQVGDPDNEEMLCKYYTEYIKNVKATIPTDRLCLIQLEDGLDWNSICPFLGLPIPDEDYPGRNEPEKFKKLLETCLQPAITAATMRLAAVAVPISGVLGWMCVKYGPGLMAALRKAS
ncbi:hypothetical protein N7492_000402 [Penicillium capsulatum]|uniref:P-loop containing nucleoside triphosphate hydrolase protein n=1 Tax=Penicillium capsulatum TaxID=69766 RepID=A0A9W9LYI0_9EURO|nr:hypothetical protein N7492_000402 [Penicillium capsulatum]KAJ6130536.1 hypothetical protein N7512_003316 [Penicillium capsulatum]